MLVETLTNKDQRGFTLTEIALVLGIAGLILGALWAASSIAFNGIKINKAHREVLEIVNGVRSMYSGQSFVGANTGGTAPGDFTGALVAGGYLPSDMAANGFTVNPWGTTAGGGANGITVASQSGVWACDPGNSGFVIIFWGIPSSACVQLLTLMATPELVQHGLLCAYSDGTGPIALDGSSNLAACAGNVALGFSLK